MKTKHIVLTALFTAITVVLAQIAIPTSPVPFSLSVVAIFLAGALLTPRFAFLAELLYVALGAFGLPVFAGFKGGLGVILGPTGGYIIAYPLMALSIALSIKLFKKRSIISLIVGMAIAIIICYVFGATWLAVYLNISAKKAFMAGVVPFISFDIIKIVASTVLAIALGKALTTAKLLDN